MLGYPDTLYDLYLYGQVFTKMRSNFVNTYQNPEFKKRFDVVDNSLLPLVYSFHIFKYLAFQSVDHERTPDEGDSRNTSCGLYYISTFVLLLRIVGVVIAW
jgi:hypothetical protein